MFTRIAFALGLLVLCSIPASAQDFDPNYTGTFSIIALDPATGQLGMAVQSKAFAPGNRVTTAKGGLVVIAHQASANPIYGFLGVQLIEAGMSPQEALDQMVRGDAGRESRQVAILDIKGRTAAYTGGSTSDWKGHKCGVNYCAEGNTLAGPAVVDNLASTFEKSTGPLADRLLAALDAAQAAGGDARGMQGAALTIFKPLAGAGGFSDREIDLRVDDNRKPLVELRRLLDLYWSGQLITQGNQKINGGDMAAGMTILIEARDKSPDNDNAWTALASAYLKVNNKAEALAALKKAIELNPGVKRQASHNRNFASLQSDPEFMKLTMP